MANTTTFETAQVSIQDSTGQKITIDATQDEGSLSLRLKFEPLISVNEPGGLAQYLAQLIISGIVEVE